MKRFATFEQDFNVFLDYVNIDKIVKAFSPYTHYLKNEHSFLFQNK